MPGTGREIAFRVVIKLLYVGLLGGIAGGLVDVVKLYYKQGGKRPPAKNKEPEMARTAKTLKPCTCSLFTAYNLENDTEVTTICNSQTGRDFAPGHDAKLKGNLIRWAILGYEIRVGGVTKSAEGWAESFGFGYMVANGIKASRERIEAKAAKKMRTARSKAINTAIVETTKMLTEGIVPADQGAISESLVGIIEAEEAAHAATEKAKVEARQESMHWTELPGGDEPETVEIFPKNVRAKVGRWEYDGTEADGVFVYKNKAGETLTTRKYKLV